MFTRLFFLATLAVFVATQGFSSGVFIPRLISQTKIKRPFQKELTETFVFEISVGDKGEVRGLTLSGCVDKTGTYGWVDCPNNRENNALVLVIQKEVVKNWKYEPKERFAINLSKFRLDVSDKDFRPLKPRR